MILERTKGFLDITEPNQFPKFRGFWKSLVLKLNKAGKGDIQHHKAVPEQSLKAIYKFLSILSDLMVLDDSYEEFKRNLDKIPEDYRQTYHYLAQYGAIFIILSQVHTYQTAVCLHF